jgi:hypothetical protein
MPEQPLGNYKVESQLGVLYRVVTKPVPRTFVLNSAAVLGTRC